MTKTMDAVDCQGFAGGFTLGAVQAGFRLVGKREHPGGFGLPACEANRHLLGDDWQAQCAQEPEWEARDVPYVFGNPPCSGFSLMSSKHFRGMDSKVNSCMWDLYAFAARCRPEVVVMESVGQAYTQGHPLMTRLRAKLEDDTGLRYHLTHVMQDAYSLGGAAIRRRYFMVCHRVPFGVEPHDLRGRLPVLRDVIGDLEGLGDSWEAQPLRRPPSWWSERLRNGSTVDGHATMDCLGNRRALELLADGQWQPRQNMTDALRAYWARHECLPPLLDSHPSREKFVNLAPTFRDPEKQLDVLGFNQPYRWSYNRPARVVTGAALGVVVHPVEPRLMTHREALRVLGFPDSWKVAALQGQGGVHAYWGKGVTVDAGRWISEWVRRSLEGNPGTLAGEEVRDRETLVDVSKDWRPLAKELGVPH